MVRKALGLVGALVRLPLRIVKLVLLIPVRLVGLVLRIPRRLVGLALLAGGSVAVSKVLRDRRKASGFGEPLPFGSGPARDAAPPRANAEPVNIPARPAGVVPGEVAAAETPGPLPGASQGGTPAGAPLPPPEGTAGGPLTPEPSEAPVAPSAGTGDESGKAPSSG